MKQRLNSTVAALLITLVIVAAAAALVFMISPPRAGPGPMVEPEEFTPPTGFRQENRAAPNEARMPPKGAYPKSN